MAMIMHGRPRLRLIKLERTNRLTLRKSDAGFIKGNYLTSLFIQAFLNGQDICK